jgi:histone H3/H4
MLLGTTSMLTSFAPLFQDYLLPRALTQRLAKSVLPPNTTIQKDALLAIQKAATVFVSYLSSQYAKTNPFTHLLL